MRKINLPQHYIVFKPRCEQPTQYVGTDYAIILREAFPFTQINSGPISIEIFNNFVLISQSRTHWAEEAEGFFLQSNRKKHVNR